MKIAILGYGLEGKSAYEYFSAQEYELTICDQNATLEVPPGAETVLGEQYLDNLDRFDLLIRSPGLSPAAILERNPNVASKLSSQINEFMKASPTKNIIGITGTKGKGTTSTLIARMLGAGGHQVRLGGNIGVPPLSFIHELTNESWVVLELSSFQLIDLKQSPHIAVCLMVVPEHLNWHGTMQDYTLAKSQLFSHQKTDDYAIYFANNPTSRQIAENGDGQKVPYYTAPGAFVENGAFTIANQVICPTSDIKLVGEHNWQNVCAALTAVWQAGMQNVAELRSVLKTFSGLEHRLELVRELNGVRYFDDSFGTTPETAIVALQAFSEPKVIVLGGSDKRASYDELAKAVASSNVRKALLIGDQAGRIQTALEQAGFTNFAPGGDDMKAIVANAQAAAQSGDVVLLSPACASFGMFIDYKDRGNQFKQAVQALA